jgi:hypothetical protein
VSWIENMLEQRLSEAAASGELDTPHLSGKPIPGIDEHRGQGWWAEQFVKRELSHDRRAAADAAAGTARAGFWRAATLDDLRDRVSTANAAINRANLNLIDADRLELFDWTEIVERWRRLQRV